jgi:hypothetical protein
MQGRRRRCRVEDPELSQPLRSMSSVDRGSEKSRNQNPIILGRMDGRRHRKRHHEEQLFQHTTLNC